MTREKVTKELPRKIAGAVAKCSFLVLGFAGIIHGTVEAMNYLNESKPPANTAIDQAKNKDDSLGFILDIGEITLGALVTLGAGIVIATGERIPKQPEEGEVVPDFTLTVSERPTTETQK